MKSLGLAGMLLALAGCGRTSLDPCVQGQEECACFPNGACDPGLMCVANRCERPTTAVLEGTGGRPGSGGRLGSGGGWGSGGVGGSTTFGDWFGGGGSGSGGITSGLGGSGKGGSPGAGGTTAAVTFINGQAQGAMTGYGWVALGADDTLSSPTCGGASITSATPCASTIDWPRTGLCVTGMIPAVVGGDYDANWGILFSANASLVGGGSLGQAYQAVTFNLTGMPSSGLRAVVHRKWDQDTLNYCANMTSGKKLAFSDFNSSCWDGTGMRLNPADVAELDWIGVQIPSASTPIRVYNLCLTSIFFD